MRVEGGGLRFEVCSLQVMVRGNGGSERGVDVVGAWEGSGDQPGMSVTRGVAIGLADSLRSCVPKGHAFATMLLLARTSNRLVFSQFVFLRSWRRSIRGAAWVTDADLPRLDPHPLRPTTHVHRATSTSREEPAGPHTDTSSRGPQKETSPPSPKASKLEKSFKNRLENEEMEKRGGEKERGAKGCTGDQALATSQRRAVKYTLKLGNTILDPHLNPEPKPSIASRPRLARSRPERERCEKQTLSMPLHVERSKSAPHSGRECRICALGRGVAPLSLLGKLGLVH